MRGEAAAGARSLTVGAVLLTTRPPALRAPPLLALPQSLGRRHRARRRSGRRRYFRIDGPDCFESRVESRSHTSLPPFPRPREGPRTNRPCPSPPEAARAVLRDPTATQPPPSHASNVRSRGRLHCSCARTSFRFPATGRDSPVPPPAGRGPRSRPALPPRSPTARAARPRPARVAPRDTYKLRFFPQVPAENERDTDLAT